MHPLVSSTFRLLIVGCTVGCLATNLWAEPPEVRFPQMPWLGGEPLNPLAGATAQAVVRGPWELPTLPAPAFEPGIIREDPTTQGGWRKEEILPLTGPVFLFGQVQKGEEWMATPGSKVIGDTGLACKLPSIYGTDLLFRLGPELTFDRPARSSDRFAFPMQSRWLRLDLQARWSLLGPVGLEWQGAAVPAVADGERDRLIQDIRAVIPLGKTGQFRLGAKRTWENTTDTKSPWAEETQIYGGFKIGW